MESEHDEMIAECMENPHFCIPDPPDMDDFREIPDHRFARLIRAFQQIQKVNLTSVVKIAPGDFFILHIIEGYSREHPGQEGIYVNKIAQKAGMASSQVSRTLRGLEERKLISRSVDEKDRRNTYVFITEEGKEIYRTGKQRMKEFSSHVVQRMGEEKTDMLIQLCTEIAEAMEQVKKAEREAK